MEGKEARKGAMAASESGVDKTKFAMASCVIAAIGGVIFGYDIGVSGGVMSMGPFLERLFPNIKTTSNHYCLFNNQVLTTFTSGLYMSAFGAYLMATTVTRSWGRKPSIFIAGVSFLAGSALGSFAQNVPMIICARLLLGVGVGFANESIPLYLSEMAPAKYRGAVSKWFQLCIGIGFLTANFTNFVTQKLVQGWRVSLALAMFPSFTLAMGSLYLPETPKSIIETTGDVHKAELMLRRIHGRNDVQEELAELTAADTDHGIWKLLQRQYRHELVMAVAIPFVQQVTGISVIAFYGPVLFRALGFGESGSLMWTLVTGFVGTASTYASVFVVDGMSVNTRFVVGGVQMLVSQIIIGVIMKVADGGGYRYAVVFLVCVYVSGFGWSWGPLGWLVPCEIFPLEIRSEAQIVTVAMSFLFTLAMAQSLPPMLCKFGASIFLFFGFCVVVTTVLVPLLMPETNNNDPIK